MGSEPYPDTCDWCGKQFSVMDKNRPEDHQTKNGNQIVILCSHCSPDVQRRVSGNHDDAVLDIPHEPMAEASLIQETRERLSMLKNHVAEPEAVGKMNQLDKVLENLMFTVSETDEYKCPCIEDSMHSNFEEIKK